MKKTRYFLFPLLVALTFWIILRESSLTQIFDCLRTCSPSALAAAIGCMVVFVLCEAANLQRCLRLTGRSPQTCAETVFSDSKRARVRFSKQALPYALTGFFFSGITPFASGGQPMQLYHMHKDGISAARGAAALAMELASFQAAAVTIAAIGLLRFHALILQTSGFAGTFLLLGFAVNLSLLALLLCAILSPRLLTRASALIAGLLQKLRACKAARLRAATGRWVEDYQNCAACLRDMPGEAVLLFLTSLLQLAALHSIPYWVSLSLGMQQVSLPQMLSIQAVLFLFVSVIPLPGGAGAGEGGFLLLFASIFSGGCLQSAMLLSRFASFYLPLLLSGIFLWIQNLRNSR